MIFPKIQTVKPDSTETDSRETPTASLDGMGVVRPRGRV